MKLLRQYERDRKPLEALSDEDRFMMQFSRIERLNQRMSIMVFMGNFSDNVQMLTPVRNVHRQEETYSYRALIIAKNFDLALLVSDDQSSVATDLHHSNIWSAFRNVVTGVKGVHGRHVIAVLLRLCIFQQLHAIIAASVSIKSSQKLKKILEVSFYMTNVHEPL